MDLHGRLPKPLNFLHPRSLHILSQTSPSYKGSPLWLWLIMFDQYLQPWDVWSPEQLYKTLIRPNMILFIFHKPYNLNIINNIKRHNCDLARSWHQKNTSHFMCCKTFTSSVLEFFSEADWGRDPQRQQTFQRLNKSCKVVVSEVVRLMICFGCVSVQCGWPEKMFIIQCSGVLYIYIYLYI